MSIPKFRQIILPFLESVSDGKKHSMRGIEAGLAKKLQISEEDLSLITPSGRMGIFSNRVGWSRTYLKKAGLVFSPERGFVQITDLGKEVLSKKPKIIDSKFLEQFSTFREFQNSEESSPEEDSFGESEDTPTETIENEYQKIAKGLQIDLLDNLKNSSPSFFEQAVIDLLLSMGYGGSRKDAGQAIGRSGDEGVDGVIKEDKLGLDLIYVQAKRWNNPVGRPEVQSFVGALNGKFAKKGIFITTSNFTKEALEYVNRLDCKVILIDGQKLVDFMIEHNVGVSVITTYEIKKIDSDYFLED